MILLFMLNFINHDLREYQVQALTIRHNSKYPIDPHKFLIFENTFVYEKAKVVYFHPISNNKLNFKHFILCFVLLYNAG